MTGPAVPRTATTFDLGSIAGGATQTGAVALDKMQLLIYVSTTCAVRLRLYGTVAQRNADLTRPVSEDPGQTNIGCLLELVTNDANLVYNLSPAIILANQETVPADQILYSCTNNDATQDVQITFDYMPVEV